MIRLFAALELPPTVRTRLTFLQGGIPGARWIPEENFHLTLCFMGDVDGAMARDIDDALTTISFHPFSIELKSVGEFGGRDPRAVWAAVAANEALTHLASKIDTAMRRVGLDLEARKYVPHVTLARLKDPPIAKVKEFLTQHSLFASGLIDLQSFTLFSSHASSHGSLYRAEQRYPASH